MTEKITLRLKSNHDVVLPEGELTFRGLGIFQIDYSGSGNVELEVDEDVWEPVPPPYELPTGLGAVVEDPEGRRYVLADPGDRTGWITGGIWENEKFVLGRAPLTTLSEGVRV